MSATAAQMAVYRLLLVYQSMVDYKSILTQVFPVDTSNLPKDAGISELVPVYARERVHPLLFDGMVCYALMKDIEATSALESALSSYSDLTDPAKAVTYVMLYDLYSRNHKNQEAEAVLNHIRIMHSGLTTMECYSSVYGYIVIPFLRSVGEKDLAEKICTVWLVKYKVANLNCDPLNFSGLRSRENIIVYSSCNN